MSSNPTLYFFAKRDEIKVPPLAFSAPCNFSIFFSTKDLPLGFLIVDIQKKYLTSLKIVL